MKSVRLHGTGDLQIHDEPVPIAGEHEKLVPQAGTLQQVPSTQLLLVQAAASVQVSPFGFSGSQLAPAQ